MARLIRVRPDVITMALDIMYHYVMKELPDYICASFMPSVTSKKTGIKFECDMIILFRTWGSMFSM